VDYGTVVLIENALGLQFVLPISNITSINNSIISLLICKTLLMRTYVGAFLNLSALERLDQSFGKSTTIFSLQAPEGTVVK